MRQNDDIILERAISARRESKDLDFKEKFDPNRTGDWCEIVKDIVAMANSGGGVIVIGVKDDGSLSERAGENASGILQIDPAKITDKIAKYTGDQFGDFTINEVDRGGHQIAVLQIDSVSTPMVFIQPGEYESEIGRRKTAFSKGTVYFRHGAKSEPGNSKDLGKSFERELKSVRKLWLRGIRRVVSASSGGKSELLPPEVVESNLPGAHPIRIVDTPNAQTYRKSWDESPYQSAQEILIGALKSWKHDKTKTSYASEPDMWTLYASRNSLYLDEEKAEFLLESAINRHAPFFFFAKSLPHHSLINFIKRVAVSGKYSASNMVLRLAYAIGGKPGSELLDYVVENCSYPSVRNRGGELKKTVLQRKSLMRLKRFYGTSVKSGEQYIDVERVEMSDLEKLMDDAIKREDKGEIKRLDAFLYSPELDAKERSNHA